MKKIIKRIWKILLKLLKGLYRSIRFLVILVVLALGTVTLLVQYFVSPDSLKVILEAQLQDVFHRPVQIQDVKFNLYQGIRVQGLRVLESPEFARGEFLSSDYLLAKYRWKALLHKRLEFEQIQMVAPRIHLVHAADGRWNITDILTSSATHHAELQSPKFTLPIDLKAHVISLEHGTVEVNDIRHERNYAFEGVDLSFLDFDLKQPFQVYGSLENSQNFQGAHVRSHLSFNGSLSLADLHLDQALFRADEIDIRSGGKTARATLSLKDFQHPQVSILLKLPRLDSDFLAQYHGVPSDLLIPPSRWRIRFSLPEEYKFSLDSLTVTAGGMRLQGKGSMGLSKGSKPFRISWTVPSTPLAEAVSVWEGLKKFELSGRVSGNGEVVGDFTDLDHTLAVEKVELDASRFGGKFFRNVVLTGVDGRFFGTRNFDTLGVDIDAGSLKAYDSVLSELDLRAFIHNGNLEFQHLNAKWDKSFLKLRGVVKRLSSPKEIHVEGSVDKVWLDSAIETVTKISRRFKEEHPTSHPSRAQRLWSQVFKYSIPKSFPSTSGLIHIGEVSYPDFQTFNLEMQWNLHGISTGLNHARGDIRIGFGPGRVADIPALENQDPHNILRVLFLPFVFMHRLNNLTVISASTAYPKSLDFTRIYGDYGLKRGVVTARLFHVDSPELLVYSDGQMDFPKEKINLHILTRLTQSRGPLPEYLTDEKGRPSIGFFVEDNLNKPTLRLELKKMSADAIEKALQKGLERGRGVFQMGDKK